MSEYQSREREYSFTRPQKPKPSVRARLRQAFAGAITTGQRSQDQCRLLSHPLAATLSVVGSNIEPSRSNMTLFLLTYVASVNDALKHHSRATSNAKHPTPETLRTCDASVCGDLKHQRDASYSLNPNACPNAQNPMLDVAPRCGAGYIDAVAFVGDPQPR